MKTKNRTAFLVKFSILVAIEAIFCFTPLGSIPAIGPVVATLMAIPVIVTAIILGPGAGTAMGFLSGLFSFIDWTFKPSNPAIAFLFTPFYTFGDVSGNFWSVLICFVPRTLVGVVAGLLFKLLSRPSRMGDSKNSLSYILSGFFGSLTNTIFVILGFYVFFGDAFGETQALVFAALGGIFLTSGIPEAVVGAIIAVGVCRPIRKYIA